MGAVKPAHSFLKIVTMATMNPPMAPPNTHGMTAAGFALVRNMFQVQDAVRTTRNSKMAVLFTAP